MEKPKRLVSIDLLRGLTVMLMIFVNNGAGHNIFPILKHSQWNGMTLADCVFPSFLFIMGMSTYLSLKKYNYQWSKPAAHKIIKRAVLLFLIGLGLNWLDMAVDGRPFDFAHLRIWGVMQRLGICYLLCAAMALTWRRGFIPIIVAGLAAYSALLLCRGGFNYDASTNILARVDNSLFGWDHLYHKSPVDPEGLVSTFSATLHTMIGFVVMEYIDKLRRGNYKLKDTSFLDIIGLSFFIIGLAMSPWLPINKRVWSTSYVLVSIGTVCIFLAVMIYVVDKPNNEKRPLWEAILANSTLLKSFGMNPLVLYVGSEVLAIIVGGIGLKDIAFNALNTIIPNPSWAGFAYAAIFTAIFATIGIYMYKKKIFVKL